jgi:hypothetical protein
MTSMPLLSSCLSCVEPTCHVYLQPPAALFFLTVQPPGIQPCCPGPAVAPPLGCSRPPLATAAAHPEPKLVGGQATAASRDRHPRPAARRVGSSSPRPTRSGGVELPQTLLPLAVGTLGRRHSVWGPQAGGRPEG